MFSDDDRRPIVRRARTLSERLRLARSALAAGGAAATADKEAFEYLELWNRAFAPGDRAAFLRRLAWDGITLEQAALALSGGATFHDGADEWVARFERLAAELDEAAVLDASLPFAEIWGALATAGLKLLERRRPGALAELGMAASSAWARQLARELAHVGALAVYEAFRQHGASDHGRPPPGRARYDAFVTLTLEDRCAALGRAYPLWLRHVLRIVEGAVDAAAEMLARLALDRAALAETFGREAGPLSSADFGLSDPHHGRRRAARLVFASGLRVIYKPRPVGGERGLDTLIGWLAARGIEPPLRRVPVLDRRTYGWMADVQQEAFSTREEVREYFRRAGALLCLMHLLRARDLHWENVVATRDGPVVVDAELLLQPRAADEGTPTPTATGLLSCLQYGPAGDVTDVGGLRGDQVPLGPVAERVWSGLGTDALTVAEQRLPVGPKANRVLLEGHVQSPEDHADDMVEGFEQMYRAVLSHRDALLAPDGPFEVLRAVRARVLVRPSQQYAGALHALADPRFQQDGRRWGCALESLNRRHKFSAARPPSWAFVAAEREALEHLDLPAFWTPADGTTVFAGHQPVAVDYFDQSGLEAAAASIAGMDESDLARHRAALARALSQSTRSRFARPLIIPAAGARDHRPALVATALWIAQELPRANSIAGADRSSDPLRTLRLYDGTAGLALFLAGLAAVTGDDDWREAARQAAAPLRQLTLARAGTPVPTGATTGAGSIVYTLTVMAQLGDPACLEAARRLGGEITEDVLEADPSADVSGGLAGALLALLALHRATGDGTLLARATYCGRLLLDRQVATGAGAAWPSAEGPPLPGFAHGAAGIAYALTRLHAATGDPSYLPAVARAHAYERSLFSLADGNWPARAGDPDRSGRLMTAWCHGAPGIGLARAFAHTVIDDPELETEVAVAIETTVRPGAAQADHLCCGNLGRADVLFTIGRLLRSAPPLGAAMQIAGRVVGNARDRGHFRLSTAGGEYEVFTPGFFNGLSGIGYTLLRFAEPDRLPSVLAFEA